MNGRAARAALLAVESLCASRQMGVLRLHVLDHFCWIGMFVFWIDDPLVEVPGDRECQTGCNSPNKQPWGNYRRSDNAIQTDHAKGDVRGIAGDIDHMQRLRLRLI